MLGLERIPEGRLIQPLFSCSVYHSMPPGRRDEIKPSWTLPCPHLTSAHSKAPHIWGIPSPLPAAPPSSAQESQAAALLHSLPDLQKGDGREETDSLQSTRDTHKNVLLYFTLRGPGSLQLLLLVLRLARNQRTDLADMMVAHSVPPHQQRSSEQGVNQGSNRGTAAPKEHSTIPRAAAPSPNPNTRCTHKP